MRRPVKISSLASGAPRIRGRSWVPPIPGKIPSVVSGTPNTAVSLATMKSERIASSQPPASAKPSTAAMTGTGQRSTLKAPCSKITCWARHVSSDISLRSLRSPPAQNARSPAPVKTMARTRESRRSPSKQARRSSPIAVFIAFIASGRFSVTVTTKPSAERSTSRCRYCAVSGRATARSLAEKKLATLQRNWPLGPPVARRRHWLNSCFPSTRPEPRGWHRVCGSSLDAMGTERRQEHPRPPETGPEDGREAKVGAMTVAPRGQSQAPVGRRFGDLLVSDRLVTQEQLDLALADQKRTGEKLGEILVRLRLLTEDRLIHFLSRQYGIPEVTFPEKIAPEIIKLIPDRIARKYGVVPIGRTIGSVTLALADPTNLSALDDVAFMTGLKVVPTIASPSVIRRAIERYYETAPKAIADVLSEVEAESAELEIIKAQEAGQVNLSDLRTAADDMPIIPGELGAPRRAEAGRLRHPHRPGRRDPGDQVPDRRHPARGDGAAQAGGASARVADQDHGEPRHRRAAAPAGRAHQAPPAVARDRLPRLGPAVDLRRERRAPAPRQASPGDRPEPARVRARRARRVPEGDEVPARPGCHHRADRFGQNHHALLGAPHGQLEGPEHRDRRGPRGVRAGGRDAGPGQRRDRPHLRSGTPLLPPSRPRRHPRRRDARPGDGPDRRAGGADRAPGADHAPHEQRRRDHLAADGHGRPVVPPVLVAPTRRGAAARAQSLPGVPRALRGQPRDADPVRPHAAGGQAVHALQGPRLPRVPQHRDEGPDRSLRGPAGDARNPRSHPR